MILDAQHLFSDAQALTATAASTNLIDFGSDRNIGIGEPMAVVVTVDTALAGTSPTINIAVQMDDSAAFSSPVSVVTSQTYSALAQGAKVVIPIPPDTSGERFCRLNYTLGGTTPTITVTAALIPMNMVQNEVAYPKGYTIS